MPLNQSTHLEKFLILSAMCLAITMADDRFSCCMSGWKELRGVTLCPAPCCHGYEERIMDLPLLQRPSICHKLSDKELAGRQKIQALLSQKILLKKTNSVESIQRDSADSVKSEELVAKPSVLNISSGGDELFKNTAKIGNGRNEPMQPNFQQRSDKAALEFEEFLFRNQKLFRHFLSEGVSAKELMIAFQEFLKKISSPSHQEGYFRG